MGVLFLLAVAAAGAVAAPAKAPAAKAPAAAKAPPASHDYPTADRVLFVEACVRDHPGGYYEMVDKCSCTLDTIAREVSYDDYVEMSTATNANSIGGERGGYIRDVEVLQQDIRKFRTLQAQALKSCLVGVQSPH